MQYIILFLKGLIIGLAKIIPGVSGACLAVSLNVYESSIIRLNNFFKYIKDNVCFFMPLGSGILLSILLGSNIMLYLYTKIPLYLISFFIGLLLGTIPNFITKQNIKGKDYILVFTIFIMLIFIYQNLSFAPFIFDGTIKCYTFVFFLGIVEAITMIIPGLSGTATYMILGSYTFVLSLFASPLKNTLVLLLFGLGFIVSAILIIKLISLLFKKYSRITWSIIFAFFLFSCYFLVLQIIDSLCKTNLLSFILLVIMGYFLANCFSDN